MTSSNSMERRNYIIYAPSFDPDSGGSIFLHQLVHALREAGEDAALWPWGLEPHVNKRKYWAQIFQKPHLLWTPRQTLLRKDPTLNTVVAGPKDLSTNTIVVYPEVTLGNPLGAAKIARWLLYKPGIKDPFEFTDNELFFRAGEMSDLPELTSGAQDLYLWRRNPVYRNQHRPDRKGACYTVRKGAEKPRISETENAICIDGRPHEEIADIFNQTETFYSYDEATLYSQFAAICGCDSVIVPGMYANRSDWVKAHPMGRYGVAYGLNDLEHARATRDQLSDVLDEKERAGIATVRAFIERTQQHDFEPRS